MPTAKYLVNGMTCEHCVRAVREELRRLHGVSEVSIGLVPGGASDVSVTCAELLPDQAVVAALDEAGGYSLAHP